MGYWRIYNDEALDKVGIAAKIEEHRKKEYLETVRFIRANGYLEEKLGE